MSGRFAYLALMFVRKKAQTKEKVEVKNKRSPQA